MNADRERAERIAKKHGMNKFQYASLSIATAALEEMALEVRRETIEECAPKWISVKDRLPEHFDEDVLWYRGKTDGFIFVESIDKDEYGFDDPRCSFYECTHWMSLAAIRALLPAAKEER